MFYHLQGAPKWFDCPLCFKENTVKITIKKEKDVRIHCQTCDVLLETNCFGPYNSTLDYYYFWLDGIRDRDDLEAEAKKEQAIRDGMDVTKLSECSFYSRDALNRRV